MSVNTPDLSVFRLSRAIIYISGETARFRPFRTATRHRGHTFTGHGTPPQGVCWADTLLLILLDVPLLSFYLMLGWHAVDESR